MVLPCRQLQLPGFHKKETEFGDHRAVWHAAHTSGATLTTISGLVK
jgi:hypothetical protein